MQCTFKISGMLVRFKQVRNGYTMAIKERFVNHLAKPKIVWVAIWGQKAQAIGPKLKTGQRFEFSGELTTNTKKGKTYTNYTVDRWLKLKPIQKQYKPRSEPDDDYYVPQPSNWDQKSHRLNEGFEGRQR
ncbi:MAG: hypothetical protein GY807_18475 [Gammaproteobacteria bacterium]|nr:hypothetical protein [Gammaproteobacteria bacterium]